jgi:hypothetical protein
MSAIDAAPVEALVRRAELVAKAEEQAAIATEQAALAHEAGTEDLLSLPVATLALEQTALLYAGAYARWGQLAEQDDDKLLARSLETVARTLRTLAEQAHAASDEASGYAEAVKAEAEADQAEL